MKPKFMPVDTESWDEERMDVIGQNGSTGEHYGFVHNAAYKEFPDFMNKLLNQKNNPLKTQIGGDHYKTCSIQPVEYIEANKLAFLEGCVVKRVTRHNKPTGKGKQDIEKAIHELELLLKLRYGVDSEAH